MNKNLISLFLRNNNYYNTLNHSKQSLWNKHIYSFSTAQNGGKEETPQLTSQNAQQIIDSWVKKNKVVLFMKGTPANPLCGYSNFVVQLLKKYGLNEYKAVNVLENNIVRQQVKQYSKWPTYPQLYIGGQLVGGSDILHEMHKDQSLQKLLQDKGLI